MNINSNRISTDTQDNTNSNRYQSKGIDYRGIATLVAISIIGALLMFLVLYIIKSIDCYFSDCVGTTYAFYGYMILMGAIMTGGLLFGAARLVQAIINSAFIRGMSMPIHRKDLRKHADKAFAVENQLAKSEMYRGLDALTNTGTTGKKEDIPLAATFSDEVPFDKVT